MLHAFNFPLTCYAGGRASKVCLTVLFSFRHLKWWTARPCVLIVCATVSGRRALVQWVRDIGKLWTRIIFIDCLVLINKAFLLSQRRNHIKNKAKICQCLTYVQIKHVFILGTKSWTAL